MTITLSDNHIDAITRLEQWRAGSKARAVSIGIDTGYGATCWEVELFSGSRKVYAAEVNFVECEPEPDTVFVHFSRGDNYFAWDGKGYRPTQPEDMDWPGLAATIHAAIDKAEELGL